MKKYQQQNNYVTILAKLQATHFCDREIPDLQIFIVNESLDSSRLGQWATLPLSHLLRQNHGSRVLILSLIIAQAPSISTQIISNIHMFVY